METKRDLYFPWAVGSKNRTTLVKLDYYGCATEARAEYVIRKHLVDLYGRVENVYKTGGNEFYIGARLVGRILIESC